MQQVFFNGRWLNPFLVRVCLYNKHGMMRVAENYFEYQQMLDSKEWFESLPKQLKKRKTKVAANDDNCT